MAIVLFANSNCCLRWSICEDMNHPSLVVAWALLPVAALVPVPVPVIPVSLPVLMSLPVSLPVPVSDPVFCLGVTTMVDPLGAFPWGVVVEAGGIVTAPLAALAVLGAPVPSVVMVGTMFLIASSFRQSFPWLSIVDYWFWLLDVDSFSCSYSFS